MKTCVFNPVQTIEIQEIIDKLIKNGYGELVTCLIENENDCYTKKGRLNKSATSRKLGWKSKKLEDTLEEMKEILGPEFSDFLSSEEDSEIAKDS